MNNDTTTLSYPILSYPTGRESETGAIDHIGVTHCAAYPTRHNPPTYTTLINKEETHQHVNIYILGSRSLPAVWSLPGDEMAVSLRSPRLGTGLFNEENKQIWDTWKWVEQVLHRP
jgi:hypothetical protein